MVVISKSTIKVAPKAPSPERLRFKGYRDFIVQDLRIHPHNTRYRSEVRQTPDAELLLGEFPESRIRWHFGPKLRRYALYQHHHSVGYLSATASIYESLFPTRWSTP